MELVKPNDARGIIYYVALLAVVALVIVDIAGDGAQWSNLGIIVLIVVMVAVRPGGIHRGR